MAAVSLEVGRTAPSSIAFEKYNFYINITISTASSHGGECTAPSSIFSDKVDCDKFITISKATKEKIFFSTIITHPTTRYKV